jgi:ABC-2 type transport system permease protein
MLWTLDIALKDLTQLLRDRKTFLFLLIMPVAFTLLFGVGFGGTSSSSRLPVGFLDEDGSSTSRRLRDLLAASEVISLEETGGATRTDLETRVSKNELAAAVVVPAQYGHNLARGKRSKLVFVGDPNSASGTLVKSEVLSAGVRLENALRTALSFEQVVGDQVSFEYILKTALDKWKDPPIRVTEIKSELVPKKGSRMEALAHTSPAMMLQFAIASLLTSAQILVNERKLHALQRLLTTAAARMNILLGHYLAIFVMLFSQFTILILMGSLALGVAYLRVPLATLLVAFTTAICIAAMGLLIGVMAKNDEQAIAFSLIAMFVLGGMGGTMAPLEIAGPTFQAIGHVSPLAWAMDGFKNIILRFMGFESVLLPAALLLGYGLLFFSLAAWRFQRLEEK